MHMWICVCAHVDMCVCTCGYVCVHMRICVCAHVDMYTCMCVCTCGCGAGNIMAPGTQVSDCSDMPHLLLDDDV